MAFGFSKKTFYQKPIFTFAHGLAVYGSLETESLFCYIFGSSDGFFKTYDFSKAPVYKWFSRQ